MLVRQPIGQTSYIETVRFGDFRSFRSFFVGFAFVVRAPTLSMLQLHSNATSSRSMTELYSGR